MRESLKPRFAVRADHSKYQYYVYDTTTGKDTRTFPYTTEGERAQAAGKANLTRRDLNEHYEMKQP